MWICSAFFGHCSQAQAFQPLPSFQLLVPFHLPGYGAVRGKIKKRGRQQDCIISQNSTWSYKQSKVGLINLVIYGSSIGSHRHAIIYLLVEPLFVNVVGNSLCNDWGKKNLFKQPNHPTLSTTPRSSDPPVSPQHRLFGEGTWIPSATGLGGMGDYDVLAKTCINLGPRYSPPKK